ncbi:uncharacterized protein LOC119083802 [Bradysia coprophila]|uniref:uncharacterized protein LOC119083802 n=1 Tax=Bradysia coprophila TaxID=38358 RepID=UPI00187DB735|nr:uncharacterized protein LOC119083802 [Bradysia coprophila]
MIARLSLFVLIVVLSTAVAQKKARLSNYCSFPPCCKDKKIKPPYTAAEKKSCPGKTECTDYNGCAYQGDFSFCGENKSHDYVVNTNIVSFFSTHGDIGKYKKKTLRITQGSKTIEAIVCDTCSDSDCKGCCTKNAGKSGYLIDMESNTYARFGGSDGEVTWSCVNC